jgi:2-keto-3-deoxy-L-rhamnonate aldolase RhmA
MRMDMLAFGANDFTAKLGVPGQYTDPRVTQAISALSAAAEQHGKLLMVGGIADPALLRDFDSLGVCPLRLTGTDTDTDMLYAGAAARAERFLR